MNKNASPVDPTPERDRSNVLPLKGEIDLHVSPSVTASLNSMIEKKPERLVVDLSLVTYIDSAGLGALVAAHHSARTQGASLKLAHLGSKFQEILQVTKLLTVFEVHDTEAAAIRSFAS